MKYLLIALISLNAMAGASRDVFIRGKIGNEFDDKKVKVIDTEGQIYFLSRSVFPKELTIKQGQSFAIEVHEKELNKIKLLKK